jgi:hypothetical protein
MFRLLAYFVSAIAITSCGLATPDPTTASGKAAIIDDVNIYLNTGQCSAALVEITPLYNSANSDNNVRMAMASVYGCFAGVNFFKLASDITKTNLSAPGFPWNFMAVEFPSTNSPSDKVVESAGFGLDATMAILNPGEVLLAGDLFNTNTFNQDSLIISDRTTDSNFYSIFLTMSEIGGSENRAGANASGSPTTNPPLPWVTSSTGGMSTAGCAFASGVANFADSLTVVPTTGVIGAALNAINNNPTTVSFSSLVYAACNFACQNAVPNPLNSLTEAALNPSGKWTANACGSNTGLCASCPLLLRDRNNCAGVASDQVSCAAAGIVNFVNFSGLKWQ